MKPLLFSASILALSACAATSADEPRAHSAHEVHVLRTAAMAHDGDHRVVEIIGDEGERTVHVTSGGGTSVITVDDQRIEIIDGAVIVDGERHEFENGRIVIEAGEVRISEGFGPRHAFAWHTGPDNEHVRIEMARAMAEVERAMSEIDSIDWVAHEDALAAAFAEIENMEIDIDDPDADTWITRDGERVRFGDLPAEEQEEIREDITEARVSAREALAEAREELHEARAEGRHARIEARIARDEARRASREARHAMRWQFRDMGDAQNIRVESRDGTTRVWLDDRELEGAELDEFLAEMEARNERFAELHFEGEPNVMVFRGEDGETDVIRRGRIVIERDGDRRRVIEIERDDSELDGADE